MKADKHKVEKTNAMRLLDAAHIAYGVHIYEDDKAYSGVDVARMLGQNPDRVFKTLVTQGKSQQYYVFMIPVAFELDLKKAAQAVDEKHIAMVKSKELLGLTGYIHGGCSPIGMKKVFPTVIDESVELFDTIMCSGGRIGCQIELGYHDIEALIPIKMADLASF